MNQAKIDTSQIKTASVAERQLRWVAASITSAAATGALVALLYLTSAIGRTIVGRVPESGWGAIVAATIAGAIFGGLAIGIQRRRAMSRIAAPLIAAVFVLIVGVLVWVATWPFDTNGSARYGLAIITLAVLILVSLGTTIVAFIPTTLWRGLSIGAWSVVSIALLVGLLPAF